MTMSADMVMNILMIEDDPDTRSNLRDILELDGHRIDEAGTAAEVLAREDWSGYATILLDRKLPDGTAADLLPHFKRLAPAAAVIILTGFADVDGAIAALRQGATDYLLKPIDLDDLRARLRRIAEQKRLEEARRESERFAQSVLDSLGAHIAVLDQTGTILAVNQAWQDFATANGGAGVNIAEGADYLCACARAGGKDARTARAFAAGIHDVLAGRQACFEMEYPCHAPYRRRWFIGRVTPFQGDGPRKAVVAHLDITERKRAEERALHAERLAAIGQMLAGLTHESRNALRRGHANLELLALAVGDNPAAMELIDRQQRALNVLNRLYEEVRSYASPIRLQRRTCELPSIWRLAWDDLKLTRASRQAALRENTSCSDMRCVADPHRMAQVFRNLLENALAACPDPVEITIHCSDLDLDDFPALEICVRDNGPGIAPEQRPRVFDAFHTTKTTGTGLGLAICRRIMEAHGGQIAVGDGRGRGAEFMLIMPRGEP